MATHGKKGMQFVTGSDALKVIFNAETPTLVVQRGTPLRSYKRILMPMFGTHAEMGFSIKTLLSIARIYKSHVTFLYPTSNTDGELRNILSSIEPIKDLFESNGLKFVMKSSDYPPSKFEKAIMQEAEEENIDSLEFFL